MSRRHRSLCLAAALAAALAAPTAADAQAPAAPRPSFLRVGEHAINADAITHVTEYGGETTIWFPGKDSTIYLVLEPERAAFRRWLAGRSATFAAVGPHRFRVDRITHTRAVAPGRVEVYFLGGNRFMLHEPGDVAALEALLGAQQLQ